MFAALAAAPVAVKSVPFFKKRSLERQPRSFHRIVYRDYGPWGDNGTTRPGFRPKSDFAALLAHTETNYLVLVTDKDEAIQHIKKGWMPTSVFRDGSWLSVNHGMPAWLMNRSFDLPEKV